MLDRLSFYAFILAVFVLSFVLGSLVTVAELFPYRQLTRAYQGMMALYKVAEHEYTKLDITGTDMWNRSRRSERGVTVHDRARAYDGLTLYTTGHDQTALLIDMDGTVVHRWRLPASALAGAKGDQIDDRFYFWRKAHLFPDGDLLAIYIVNGPTPWGHALVKMDKDSNPLWTYEEHVHHDLDVAADGTIYTLTNTILSEPIAGAEWLGAPLIADSVVVLSPDGEVLDEVPVLEAFRDSDLRNLLTTVPFSWTGDALHTNAIDLVDEAIAARFPFARPGQVLLSFWSIHTIAVLDIAERKIVWALRGPWLRQHDPDFLANGNILVFDNMGGIGRSGLSRVVEIDPLTQRIAWVYAGDDARPLESPLRSAQQRLANGNTLITESDYGRIVEVTAEGEIVWEYLNPERAGAGDAWIAVVCWAQRFDRDALTFLAGRGPE